MRLLPLLFVLLFFCLKAAAQQLQGIVMDKLTGYTLQDVTIFNKSKKSLIRTDESGAFSIAATRGDTLEVSLTGYFSQTIFMNSGTNLYRRIVLPRKIISLDTVTVSGLTDYQRDSMERRAVFGKKADEKPAKFKLQKRHPLYGGPGEGTIRFDAPLSSLIQKKTKKYKRLKAFQDSYWQNENHFFIDTRYNKDTVALLTGLSGDSLTLFINSYPMPIDFARAATELEIKMWIKYNYKIWMKKKH